MNVRLFIFCWFLMGPFFGSTGEDAGSSLKEDIIAATVGEEPIYAGEVRRLQEKAARGKRLVPSALSLLQAQVLEEIVNRRLVLTSAERSGEAASREEIDRALLDLKAQLAAQRKTYEDFLKDRSITEKELRRQLAWNAYWEKQLAKYAAPARMQAYFDGHRRQFDGTEISVSHILLNSLPGETENGKDASIARTEALRQDILAGKISFDEAARSRSTAPSRSEGGKLGYIGRHGPMENAFSRAAFALNPGEISAPVRTSFGVHLIRCEEIRPGKKRLSDVEAEVRDALARELLEKLARAERPHTPVKYSEHFPHFDPQSRVLVEP